MVSVDKWSGSLALKMPHSASIGVVDRAGISSIQDLLDNTFVRRGVIHDDVRWENIGHFIAAPGCLRPVLYDVSSVRDYIDGKGSDWVERSMQLLFPGLSKSPR
jgi:hypothetical protein